MMLSVNGGLTVCSYGHALLTKMATIPINGKKKNKKKNKNKTKTKTKQLKNHLYKNQESFESDS